MSRAWSVVLVCVLVAARCLAEEADKHSAEAAHPQQQLQQQTQQQQHPQQPHPQQHLQQPHPQEQQHNAIRPLNSFNLSSGTVQLLAVAGAVVVGLVGFGALLGLLYMFGFRFCLITGTCDMYGHGYNNPGPSHPEPYAAYPNVFLPGTTYAAKSYDGGANEVPSPYSYDLYQNAAPAASYPSNSLATNAYQKRSLEYVGPILKMLSNAYEKYNHPVQSKSIEKTLVASDEAKTE